MVTKHNAFATALIACCLGLPLAAWAIPVTLQMVTDTLLVGRAVLIGDWATLASGANFIEATRVGGSASVHWSSRVIISKFSDEEHTHGLDIAVVEGRHISNPAPHPGEAAPGPLLSLGSAAVAGALYKNLDDDFTGSLTRDLKVLHDKPLHFDIMDITLIDLNPADPKSVLGGVSREFRMVIDFRHVEEPEVSMAEPPGWALLLVAGTLGGLVSVRASLVRRRFVLAA